MSRTALIEFLKDVREEKGFTWDVAANYYYMAPPDGHTGTKEDGSKYSGAGFQNYVNRTLGSKKFGKSVTRATKASVKKEVLMSALSKQAKQYIINML
jgi:hypothetical protein